MVNLNLIFPNCSSVVDTQFLVEIKEFSVGLTSSVLILGTFLKRVAEFLLFCLLGISSLHLVSTGMIL